MKKQWIAAALAFLLAGCLSDSPATERGLYLSDLRQCEGELATGEPLHCQQEVEWLEVLPSVPQGWLLHGPEAEQNGFAVYQGWDDGAIRWGIWYQVQRGGIGDHISLDPIGGVLNVAGVGSYGWSASSMAGFVIIPEPHDVAAQRSLRILIYHPHVVGVASEHFEIPLDTPALEGAPVEPLWKWDDAHEEFRVVFQVDADGGPYYIHNGLAGVVENGHSLGVTGEDFSGIFRSIQFVYGARSVD